MAGAATAATTAAAAAAAIRSGDGCSTSAAALRHIVAVGRSSRTQVRLLLLRSLAIHARPPLLLLLLFLTALPALPRVICWGACSILIPEATYCQSPI
jgi:hypothetical protein